MRKLRLDQGLDNDKLSLIIPYKIECFLDFTPNKMLVRYIHDNIKFIN